MSVAGALRYGMATLVEQFGGGQTVTQRRYHSLRAGTAGLVTTLNANGAASSGASSVNLDAARVTGVLVAGVQGTFAGHGTTYTVTGDVAASSNALASVGLTPVLASDVADDEVFTITRAYGEYTWPAYRRGYMQRDIAASEMDVRDFQIVVDGSAPPLDAGGTAVGWEDEDQALFDGERVEVRRVELLRPGAETVGYVLHVGRSS